MAAPVRPPARLALLLTLLLACLCACGQGPEKLTRAEVEAQKARGPAPGAAELPAGHPPMGAPELPAGHPPTGAAPAVALEGVVELSGPLAELGTGSIYLVGYDRATGSMALVEKHELASAVRSGPGSARLAFAMDQMHPTGTGSLVDIDLEVRIDLDGMVETKEDIVARTRVPARLGDRDVTVRLDESTRTEAPLPEPDAGG